MPKSRLDFWKPKLEGNRERDDRQHKAPEDAGWIVLTVLECEISDETRLAPLSVTIRQVERHIRPKSV